jgi:hypothetical protein
MILGFSRKPAGSRLGKHSVLARDRLVMLLHAVLLSSVTLLLGRRSDDFPRS